MNDSTLIGVVVDRNWKMENGKCSTLYIRKHVNVSSKLKKLAIEI